MILEKIAERTRQRIEEQKRQAPPAAVMAAARALDAATGFPFEEALRRRRLPAGAADGLAFICEIKAASPSKGEIAAGYDVAALARDYEAAGAAAISVLTEPFWFRGSNADLQTAAQAVRVPVLRKDFTVDPYMIYEAKLLGASAVLLICALLPAPVLAEWIALAHGLGLSALVEAHDAAETEQAVQAGARVIGVNNRDLRTFEVDLETSVRLRALVPPDRLYVSESGIRTAADISRLRAIGADAVLVGETLMRSPDRRAALAALSSEAAGGLV